MNQNHLENISSYRSDIDGLRAFAVLAVVLFHAFPGAWKGGFIGVDIFFVISGYLISGIILDDINKDRFTFWNFYSRRIRRIFPALITVLAVMLIVGWIFLLPNEYASLGKHIFGGASFSSNFFLWQESGYFDTAAKTKPLLHLWSLGIEEQFYIAFPFVLWFCAKNRHLTILAIVLFCGVSFGSNIWLSHSSPAAEFYSPLSRVWELLIGSALCVIMRQPDIIPVSLRQKACITPVSGQTIRLILAVAGMSFLLVSLLVAKRPAHWPGWIALLPTVGTAMLIAAGPNTWINRTLLSHRFAVELGLVSYPFYLWHWPLLSYAFIFYGGTISPPISIRAILVIVAFILAAATYRMIENPVRFGQRARHFKFSCLILGMLLVGGGGSYAWLHDGLPFRIPNLAQIDKAMEAMSDQPFWESGAQKEYKGAIYWEQASNKKQTTLFIGDSLAMQYWPRIDELIDTRPDDVNSSIFMTCALCLPIPGMHYEPPWDRNGTCNDYAGKALELAKSSSDITNIVIAAQWGGYLENKNKATINKRKHILSQYIKNFIDAGKNVFLVSYMPQDHTLHPKAVVSRNIMEYPHIFSIHNSGISTSKLKEKYGTALDELEKLGRETGANVIRPMDFLCGERCDALDKYGNPMYYDGWHLTSSFARYQATFIDAVMQ